MDGAPLFEAVIRSEVKTSVLTQAALYERVRFMKYFGGSESSI
jgi:hypothetical protein